MLKKILATVLCLMMFVTINTFALAETAEASDFSNNAMIEEQLITPFYSYTNSTTTSLGISNGQANSYASISGYSGTTTKVVITMTLQKKGLLGLYWSDIITWTKTFNTFKGTLSNTYNVSSGTYRVYAVYVAYSGSASETITGYSSEVKK